MILSSQSSGPPLPLSPLPPRARGMIAARRREEEAGEEDSAVCAFGIDLRRRSSEVGVGRPHEQRQLDGALMPAPEGRCVSIVSRCERKRKRKAENEREREERSSCEGCGEGRGGVRRALVERCRKKNEEDELRAYSTSTLFSLSLSPFSAVKVRFPSRVLPPFAFNEKSSVLFASPLRPF